VVRTFNSNDIDWSSDERFPGIHFKLLETRATHPSAGLSLVRAKVDVGGVIQTHTHPTETETAFVLVGEAVLKHDGKETHLSAGMGVTIPPGIAHSLHNVGDVPVELLAMHTPPTR
jgi:mannose-6-phosphate isomerase-like protein (cupin superfamily)